jgi:hypothetical protein
MDVKQRPDEGRSKIERTSNEKEKLQDVKTANRQMLDERRIKVYERTLDAMANNYNG